jgi:flagellar basal-body rod protein FlgB
MSLTNVPLMSLLRENMDWATKRQTVIAENLANADTPGYQSKDLQALDFKSVLAHAGNSHQTLTATSPNHIQPASTAGGYKFASSKYRPALNKNGVDIEDETIKMAKTKDDYTFFLNIYKKFTDMFKIALGRGPNG